MTPISPHGSSHAASLPNIPSQLGLNHQPPVTAATAATQPTVPVIQSREFSDHPFSEFFLDVPPEVGREILRLMAEAKHPMALTNLMYSQQGIDSTDQCIEVFLANCDKIRKTRTARIASFTPTQGSQELLRAFPAMATLIDLFKFRVLQTKNPEAEAHLPHHLDLISADQLKESFRLFEQWTTDRTHQQIAQLRDLAFLCNAPLLERIQRLPKDEAVDAAIALTSTLLTWAEYHGYQEMRMDAEDRTMPASWSALGKLTHDLAEHCAAHPNDARITPDLLVRLTGWCHAIQESGLLLPGATYSANDGLEQFQRFAVEDCVGALLATLGRTRGTLGDGILPTLADQLRALQISAHLRQPMDCPHMASLRVFGVLMHAGAAAIAAATPEGLALIKTTIEATQSEFDRFASAVEKESLRGFYAGNDGQPSPKFALEPVSVHVVQDTVIGWQFAGDMIAFHGQRITPAHPQTELMDKLYGTPHDLLHGTHDPLAGTLHDVDDETMCRLRMTDSMIATFRELSLYIGAMPAPQQPALAGELRAIAQLWPIETQRSQLLNWVPHAVQ